MFGRLKENFRNHTRDELCNGLQALGISARISGGSRPEEKISQYHMFSFNHSGERLGKSLGVIDIAGSPIRWVNFKLDDGTGWGRQGDGTRWYTEYGVPAKGVSSSIHVESIRMKSIPLIGKAIAIQWKGEDFGLGILSRLTDDFSLAKPMIDNHDLEIDAYPKHGCYLLTVNTPSAPSKIQWDCYETIARHLLASHPDRT